MKRPDSFLTNTTAPAGRLFGQAIDDPGGGTGTGVDNEIYNDPAYALIALIEAFKEGGISDSDETTVNSDVRDAIQEALFRRVVDPVTTANTVDDWDGGTNYTTVGELAMYKGAQYVVYNDTGNLNKPPRTNPLFWFKIPNPSILEDAQFDGLPRKGGFNDIHNVQAANYAQAIEFGRFRLGDNGDDFYKFYLVHLDGTQVTGDSFLNDDIFEEGTGSEYWNLDIIAPDELGTRTLIDSQGRVSRAMTGGGGVAPTLGEVQEDEQLRITGALNTFAGGNVAFARVDADVDGVFSRQAGSVSNSPGTASVTGHGLDFNSADSISPIANRTNDVENRVKSIVVGVDYIIVMVAA